MTRMNAGANARFLLDFHVVFCVEYFRSVSSPFMIEALMRNCLTRLGHLAGFLVISTMIVSCPARADKIKHPVAVFSGVDKITGRTIAFEASAGETVQFGSLQITERACYTRPATEAPQTTSFVEVDEIDADKKYKRIFSGWMFAASPGLHGIEHPIYDIWLTECTGGYGETPPSPDINPAEVPSVPPDTPQNSFQEPSTQQPSAPPPRHGHTSKIRAPAAEEPMAAPPREQQDGDPSPIGGPIEVGPPPGFSPVPPGNSRSPAPQN
jgi:hypothetical protein